MLRIIIGPPCAGKSTYCKENAGVDDVVVDFDLLAQALGANIPHAATGDIREAAFVARQAVIDHLVKTPDLDAWIIHTAPTAHQVAKYREVGAEFQIIDPGIDVCLERAKERPEGTDDVVRDWYDSWPLEQAVKRRNRTMKHKSVPVKFKTGAASGLKEGEFLVYPSTFTREPDSYGDVVAKGAFAKGIADRQEKGITLPGLYGHRLDDPDFFVASAIEEGEDDHGWWVKGAFDLENPKGAQTYRLVKSGRLRELSFAFGVLSEGEVDLGGGRKANELRELDVFEFSFVPVGANRDTSVVAVKSAAEALEGGVKAGQVLSDTNKDSIRDAISTLGAVTADLEEILAQDEPGDDPENTGDGAGDKDQEPSKAKSEDRPTSASVTSEWDRTIKSLELMSVFESL